MVEDKKINIVMFNMSLYSDWLNGVSNRNFHVMNTLLADERINKIIAVDYLPWTWKKVLKNYFFGYLRNCKNLIFQNLLTRASQESDKLIVVSSVASYFGKKFFFKDLTKIIKLCQVDQDFICWSCNPLLTDYFDELSAKSYVFDVVDDWTLHPSYQTIKSLIEKNYQEIINRSNLIFTVAEELMTKFEENEHVYWLPNGIDLNHYLQRATLIDKEIGDIPHPIIGYIGIVLGRLDLDIIKYLAQHNPQKSIVIAGSYKGRLFYWNRKLIKELKKYPNIYLLGYIPYNKAAMYIQQFDLGIIPHLSDSYVKATNPMKMYEYLACGKPIVASPAAGLDMFSEIKIAQTPKDFNQLVISELAEDNEQKQQARIELVKEHTWQQRIKQMLDLLYEQL
ncbi:MAG: glycosyltransferase [Candidatus Komeilibacteria bacterium]